MRILHLITWVTTGGIEHWLIDFIRSIQSDDVVMSVACRKKNTGPLAHLLTERGVRVEACPMLPNVHTYERRLVKLIKDTKADLVHNHLGATSLLAVKAAKQVLVPVVTTFHSPKFAPQTKLTRLPLVRQGRGWYTEKSVQYALEHSDMITGVSRGVLDTIAPQHASDPRYRVTYLGMPKRDSEPQKTESIRAKYGWSEDSKLLFKLGRLSPEKDPLACIEILQRVLPTVPEAKLVFLGDGVLREQIVQMAKRYGVGEKIALLGYRKDAPELLRQGKLLLQPSRYEGFGLAAVEAAVVGVPTVASNVPGLNEAVQHDRTGLLFPAGDINSMTSGVLRLLTEPATYEAFSKQAIAYAADHFAPEKCQSKMLELYREVLNKSTPSSLHEAMVKA